MGVDLETCGLPSVYACTILKCGRHRSLNNTLVVSIPELFMRDNLFALVYIFSIVFSQKLAFAFIIGSRKKFE